MARTCVYEAPEVKRQYAALVKKTREGTGARIRPGTRRALLKGAKNRAEDDRALAKELPPDERVADRDDFLSKLAKYVPAETITLTTLAFAAMAAPALSALAVLGIVAAGALLNALYLWSTVLASPTTPPPPRWFYALAATAYVLWAVAIIPPVGALFGVGGSDVSAEQTFVLALAAFLVPTLDTILDYLFGTPGTPGDELKTKESSRLPGFVRQDVEPAKPKAHEGPAPAAAATSSPAPAADGGGPKPPAPAGQTSTIG